MFDFIKNAVWVLFCVALFAAFLYGVFIAGKRGYFDKLKASNNGTKYTFSPDNWTKFYPWVAGLLAIGFTLFMLAGCSSGTSAPAPVAQSCEGTYVASVDMPPTQAERLAARNQALTIAGFPITGNDSIDNHALGGGDPDGGIYLSGSIAWTTGPLVGTQCPITGGSANIFGHPFALSGGINNAPEFGFGYEGGPVTGSVVNGKITGKLMEGGGREFVYGVLNGTFTPVVK